MVMGLINTFFSIFMLLAYIVSDFTIWDIISLIGKYVCILFFHAQVDITVELPLYSGKVFLSRTNKGLSRSAVILSKLSWMVVYCPLSVSTFIGQLLIWDLIITSCSRAF